LPGTLLFGGSFDPVHNGHLGIARAAAEQLAVETAILIPAGHPPHKSEDALAPAGDRVAMCALATASDPRLDVSDWETRQTGPTYTLHTVAHFAECVPRPLYWLIGMDSLRELHTWYRIRELIALCTLVTVRRPGTRPDFSELAALVDEESIARLRAHVLDTPEFDVSATEIRRRVRAGEALGDLVPPAVADYIAAQCLYTP
jgi:nicotinate-nucleotide adenylyltransferase